ncbi:hypothetical protein HAX54_012210, partial [Datura stramonium]|nr:hypothetical protein [Datura stramonium]
NPSEIRKGGIKVTSLPKNRVKNGLSLHVKHIMCDPETTFKWLPSDGEIDIPSIQKIACHSTDRSHD